MRFQTHCFLPKKTICAKLPRSLKATVKNLVVQPNHTNTLHKPETLVAPETCCHRSRKNSGLEFSFVRITGAEFGGSVMTSVHVLKSGEDSKTQDQLGPGPKLAANNPSVVLFASRVMESKNAVGEGLNTPMAKLCNPSKVGIGKTCPLEFVPPRVTVNGAD